MGKDGDRCDNVSLFDSILDQLGISKISQGRERAFTKAIYNSVTLIIIIVCTVTVVLTILQPFIKPLLWAVLCGSVLHPFKFALSSSFKRWLCYLENSSKPLSVDIVTVPIVILTNLSEFIGSLIISKFSAVCLCICLGTYLFTTVYNHTPELCFCVLWRIFFMLEFLLNSFMNVFQSTAVVLLMVIGFVSALTILWDSEKTKIFLGISYLTWFSLACYIASFFDYLRLPAFVLLLIVCLVGLAYESWLENKSFLKDGGSPSKSVGSPNKCISRQLSAESEEAQQNKLKQSDGSRNFIEPIKNFEIGAEVKKPLEKSKYSYHVSEPSPVKAPDKQEDLFTTQDEESSSYKSLSDLSGLLQNPHTSDLYIYTICIGCGIIVIVKNLWLLYFIAFLFVIHLTKLLCIVFGIGLLLQDFWDKFVKQTEVWYTSRSNILIPSPVAAFFKISIIIKAYVLSFLKDSCDAAASVTVILALLAAVVFVTSFLGIQIYTESFYMVRVGGQIINQTVVHNPELTQLLPEGWEDQLDSVLNSAYTYGRELLSNTLYRLLKGVPEDKAKELVETALELWDRVYQAWVMTSLEQSIGPKVTSSAVFQTWGQFLDGVQQTPGLINVKNLKSLVMENMATLSSGLESVWVILKGNASVLLQAVTTLLSVVVSHGAALLGFFINMIIFLTALFYLLSSSRVLYKPVEILTNIIPQYGNNLAVAMETASKEVIVASFKLLVFYGLWTWFIHSIFLMNIIYLPSVFAAILAVVPVLGTYWACLPGVLDLWLAQGKGLHALCLAICQFLPTTIVDTTIYTEIHGGHPYLTGLAVAGGVLCLGAQGAIIGPLALCGLLVIINLSSGFLKESLATSL